MAKKKKARKIPDPIVGEVFGNVLDEYSSYSYSAKLYMIPPVASTPPGAKPKAKAGRPGPKAPPGSIASGVQSLFGKNKKKSNGGNAGGFTNHATVALPEETVVLAQSGVTAGNMIDNITIENISKYDSGFETRTINKNKKSLNIIRLGTSGGLNKKIDVDSFIVSEYVIGLDGLAHFYKSNKIIDQTLSNMIGFFKCVLINLQFFNYAAIFETALSMCCKDWCKIKDAESHPYDRRDAFCKIHK